MVRAPRVSVVIPCYNYGRFLPECVGTVLGQDGVDVDVLIVDDASPDGSVEVAHQLAAADSRVKVLAHKVNAGHIATYNEGLAAVDGDYVVLLSADDLLTPGSLARSVALMEARPEVGMVYGFSPGFTTATPPPPRHRSISWTVWDGPEWIEAICRRVVNPVRTPDTVLRTSLMRELVGYDARLPHAADFLLWLRAAARGAIGRVNGVDQAFYRAHGANMHLEHFAGAYTDLLEKQRTFEILFEEDRPLLPEADRMHELARRGLAREALVTACRYYEVDHKEQHPPERFVAFAEDIVPGSAAGRYGRLYQRHLRRAQAGRPPVVPRRVNLAVEDVTSRVRWRRWRRYGLMGAVRST